MVNPAPAGSRHLERAPAPAAVAAGRPSGPLGPGAPPEQTVTAGKGRPARRHHDRVFQLVSAVAGLCLVGFIVFVVVRGTPSHTSRHSSALASPPPSLLAAGVTAPGFTLPALSGGQPVSLGSFRGEPVVLNFFASWCSDCRNELDAIAAEARATQGRVAFAGIDANESSTTTAVRLLREADAAYPVGVDADARVATAYLVQALPVTYFLDGQGRVVGAALGPQSSSSLGRWVARLEAGS